MSRSVVDTFNLLNAVFAFLLFRRLWAAFDPAAPANYCTALEFFLGGQAWVLREER